MGPILIDLGAQYGPQEGGPEITFRGFGALGAILEPRWPRDTPKTPQGSDFDDSYLIFLIFE